MGRTLNVLCMSVGFVICWGPVAVSADDLTCHELLTTDQLPDPLYQNLRDLEKLRINGDSSPVGKAYAKYVESSELFHKVFPRKILLEVLGNFETPLYQEILGELLVHLSENPSDLQDSVRDWLTGYLAHKVPDSNILPRIQNYFDVPTVETLLRALGEMTLEEVQELTYGSDPLHPTPESLLGKYIEETGAQTVVRTFPLGPDKEGEGEEKLAIAVSQSSHEVFQKYFSHSSYLIHHHRPYQGTLQTGHRGMVGDYGVLAQRSLSVGPGSLFPFILLKSTEANRLENFHRLAYREGRLAREPWELKGYCAKGGYNSCTHWFGNIPLGDELVDEYWFPGNVDDYAGNAPSNGPQHQPLAPYDLDKKVESDLVRRVWKVPGNMGLADLLGLRESNLAGEFANPGWVAYTLLGAAPVDRVPFVFIVTQDHQEPLNPDFELQIRAY